MKIGHIILLLLAKMSLCAADVPSKILPPIARQVSANMGPGCNLRLKIPSTAQFPVSYSEKSAQGGASVMLYDLPEIYQDDFVLGFICYVVGPGFTIGEPVRFSQNTKKWERDINNRFESWYSEEGKKKLDQATRFYELNTANAQGYVYTEDDIIGDEDSRQRHLHYCLINGPKALCGDGLVGTLKEGKQGDLTDYALQILRSIEFIDDAPAEESGPVPAQDTAVNLAH